jgi:hypothetical protein
MMFMTENSLLYFDHVYFVQPADKLSSTSAGIWTRGLKNTKKQC